MAGRADDGPGSPLRHRAGGGRRFPTRPPRPRRRRIARRVPRGPGSRPPQASTDPSPQPGRPERRVPCRTPRPGAGRGRDRDLPALQRGLTVSVRVDRRPLSVARAYDHLGGPSAGGVTVFVGRVRPDRTGGGVVHALFYEAHVGPARAALTALERTARQRFGLTGVVVWHRLGTLPVGTASVIVGAAAPHRDASFRAARFLIERLKSDVPIWKTDRARPVRRRRGPPGRHRGRSAD
jgi:molybdopterin synthase catalytic subunit